MKNPKLFIAISSAALFLMHGSPARPAAKELYRSSTKDAISHSLPPVAFSLRRPANLGIGVLPFPDKARYVVLSGPPGGTLLFSVYAAGDADASAEIKNIVSGALMTSRKIQPAEWGSPTTLKVAGHQAKAISWIQGIAHARSNFCAIYLEPNLLLEAGISTGNRGGPDCNEVISHPAIRTILETFKIEIDG
ncbi:MAG: hypothetical protein V2A66_04675 [Pseudomonadota bacterium]